MHSGHTPFSQQYPGLEQAKIHFPRMDHDPKTPPLSSPPPLETLPTPPRRTQSHTPRISLSPQTRNAIYLHAGSPPTEADTTLTSFVKFVLVYFLVERQSTDM